MNSELIIWKILLFINLFKTDSASFVNDPSNTYYKPTNVFCWGKPEYVKNLICFIKPLNRYDSTGGLEGTLLRDLRRKDKPECTIKSSMRFSGWKPWVLSFQINLCEVLEHGAKVNAFIKLFLKDILDHTNVNHTCPYAANEHLWFRNATASEIASHMHGIITIPYGLYKFDLNVTVNNTLAGGGHLTIEVGEKFSKKDRKRKV